MSKDQDVINIGYSLQGESAGDVDQPIPPAHQKVDIWVNPNITIDIVWRKTNVSKKLVITANPNTPIAINGVLQKP